MKKVILSLLLAGFAYANSLTVFAASDLRYALDELKEVFVKHNPSVEVQMIYGSSGKGATQIANGAPYDIYYSANIDFVQKLYEDGDIVTKPKLYAIGRVVIWSTHPRFDPQKGFENFTQNWVRKVSIAHPGHAPYGEKAKQALISAEVYDKVESKLVIGENISHAAQFIYSGGADIGVIALSLATAPSIADTAHSQYYLIDDSLHEPLLQAYGITKRAKNSAIAQKFYDFTLSKEALDIMKKYGFESQKE